MTTANKKCFFELLDNNLLTENKLREIAYETGFMKRNAKKIDAPDLLMHICIESLKGSPSYNDIAARIDLEKANTVSKQAICKRINERCVIFFQAVLSRIIKSKIAGSGSALVNASGKFKRVLIQDSTIIKLPLRLFNVFLACLIYKALHVMPGFNAYMNYYRDNSFFFQLTRTIKMMFLLPQNWKYKKAILY